ncbi:glycosyltransferase [Oceanobacillus sp. Castelsardo]|uniref:glycosyltransferase n=1 Tax=Oceanobacillus sp. Castelsardo TaxID=1851204 RepID=UPI00083926EF|nr:glycosyltransferase [Oceanobacillus sp. Castelsardo]
MGKNVCFLVSEHPFMDARIYKKEAKSLAKKGYNVTIIVPRKNGFLFDVDGSVFRESFLSKTFIYEGIKVVTYEQINYEKYLKYLQYSLSSQSQLRYTDSLIQLAINQKADIYHAHEFYSLYAAIRVKRALSIKGKKSKVIYDSHELEPDPLIKQSQKKLIIKKEMLRNMLNETDYVITVSPSIQSWYHSINSNLRTEVIYNSPPLTSKYKPKNVKHSGLLLAYEGTLNKKRGNYTKLLKLLELSNKKFDLKIRIIGGKKESDKEFFYHIPTHLKKKIEFSGWVNYDLIPDFMKDVDLGWVDINGTSSLNHRFAMPNKFFSYLNNGVPILANQGKDIERFVERYQCGHIVKKLHATAEDYFQALLMLYSNKRKIQNMSLNARRIMESTYSWEQMEKKLFAIYEKLIKDL